MRHHLSLTGAIMPVAMSGRLVEKGECMREEKLRVIENPLPVPELLAGERGRSADRHYQKQRIGLHDPGH